jgi:hypothetical protein
VTTEEKAETKAEVETGLGEEVETEGEVEAAGEVVSADADTDAGSSCTMRGAMVGAAEIRSPAGGPLESIPEDGLAEGCEILRATPSQGRERGLTLLAFKR